MLDWHTSGGHYDSRVVRDCKPQTTNDSYGWSGNQASSVNDLDFTDTIWNEPGAFDDAGIDDMQKGAGYVISDTYADGTFWLYEYELFAGTGDGGLTQYWEAIPRTCTDHYSRVLTLYQDGHMTGCKNYPADDPN
jgi:hypothetical protein